MNGKRFGGRGSNVWTGLRLKAGLALTVCWLGLGFVQRSSVFAAPALQAEAAPAQAAYEELPMAADFIVLPEPTEFADPAEKKAILARNREAKAKVSAGKAKAIQVLSTATPRDESFDAWFNDYVFPSMAQNADATVSQLGELRAQFIKDFVSNRTGANRQYLLDTLTLPMCQRLANGNFHPAVRVNAIILASLLKDREGDPAAAVFPVPYKPAIDFLVGLCTAPDTPDFVFAAAVSGLAHVAEIEGAESHHDVSGVRAVAQAILAGTAGGQAQWNEDTVDVLQRRAVQILGFLGDPASMGELNLIVSDGARNANLRLDAADALSRLKYTPAANPADITAAVESITRLASDGMDGESKSIRFMIEDLIAVNLLWGNVYLVDPDFKPDTGSQNQGSGEGGGGSRGVGSGGLGLGGPGGGPGAPGTASEGEGGGDRGGGSGAGGGGSRGAGGQGPQANDPAKLKSWREFDLPNYQLNLVRRRSKATIYICQKTLDVLNNLPATPPEAKGMASSAKNILAAAMKDTDEGLTDLGARPSRASAEPVLSADKNAVKNSTTVKMMEMFAKHSVKLRELLPAAEANPTPPATPATTASTTPASGASN